MSKSYFERHPKLTLSFITVFFLVFVIFLLEIFLRFTISYDIGYYMATQKEGHYSYPFGDIHINSLGYPDEEFNLDSDKKRIGYFGDSVTFGTGAGSNYRFSDILQKEFPEFEHWTFGMVNNGVQDGTLYNLATEYDLNTVIYAFNLNDILPRQNEGERIVEKSTFSRIRQWIAYNPDIWLRGKSYLYTYMRTSAKNFMTRFGYGHMGFKAAELFPYENEGLIKDVAARVNAIGKSLQGQGIKFCVLILPYEMQISDDAADTYSNLGIGWERGFIDGSTQILLNEHLSIPNIYNGIEAFSGLRRTAKVGEYFVYNKGDKIDFNHPNRKGHAVLAKYLKTRSDCLKM